MIRFPLIIFALFFCFGIFFQNTLNLELDTYFFVLLAILIIFLLFSLLKISHLKNITLLIIVFFIGAFYHSIGNSKRTHYPFIQTKIKNVLIVGEINNIELINERELKCYLNILKIDSINFNFNRNRFFLTNLWKDTTNIIDSFYNELKPGNLISFKGNIQIPKNIRNPGEFDYRDWLYSKGISGIINCYNPETIKLLNNKIFYFNDIVFQARKGIDKRINTLYNKDASKFLRGILLADRAEIDYEIKNNFINSGVIHVLAVSGLHVGFVSMIFFVLLSRFDLRLKYSLTILGLIFFLILTGAQPSVFRASVMAVTFLIAKLTGRLTNGINSLSLAALIILIINPNDLFNPGFLLSFSAVLSIVVIYPILSNKISKWEINKIFKYIILFALVSLSAQIGTLPFTLVYFNKLSLISLLANLFVIPLIGVIVSIGILSLVVSTIFIWAATIFASANSFLIDILYVLVNLMSDLSFSFIPIYNFSFLDGIIYFIFLLIIIYSIKFFENKLAMSFVIILTIINSTIYLSLDNSSFLENGKLSLVAIDVNQGDSFLIKFPNNKTALIDAGEATPYFDNGDRVIYPLLQRFGIDTLDYVFISHIDADHYGGVISLVNLGVVKKIFKPAFDNSTKSIVFENFLRHKNIPINYYNLNFIEVGNCKLYILNDTNDVEYKGFDSNNQSGIIKLVYGNNSFLFVGDAELDAENYLVNKYDDFLKSDLLKIGHHGSSTSSSDKFIDAVNPKLGLISAGLNNKFNHPSKLVLNKYKKRNVYISRTDYEGAIIYSSDGENIDRINWRK